jgi:hypothetical protein
MSVDLPLVHSAGNEVNRLSLFDDHCAGLAGQSMSRPLPTGFARYPSQACQPRVIHLSPPICGTYVVHRCGNIVELSVAFSFRPQSLPYASLDRYSEYVSWPSLASASFGAMELSGLTRETPLPCWGKNYIRSRTQPRLAFNPTRRKSVRPTGVNPVPSCVHVSQPQHQNKADLLWRTTSSSQTW